MVNKSVASNSTPLAESGVSSRSLQMQFVAAALSMSWQLAIVVLLPVVGGFKADEHWHSAPLWTIAGFVVAVTGVVLVLKRMLAEVAQTTVAASKGKHS